MEEKRNFAKSEHPINISEYERRTSTNLCRERKVAHLNKRFSSNKKIALRKTSKERKQVFTPA